MQQLINEVGEFLDKMRGRRTINADEQKELYDHWKRITGETIYCTSCGRVTAEIFKNVSTWYERRKMEIDVVVIEDEPVVTKKKIKKKK